MRYKRCWLRFAPIAAIALPLLAYADCSTRLTESIIGAERIVDSLRPEKSGQSRVFAVDGSEYTAGQATWMRAQLNLVRRACAHGDEHAASVYLQGLLGVIRTHSGSSGR